MNASEIRSLLTGIGISNYDIKEQRNGWVAAPCPLARWSHKSLRDKHPSFAVKVAAGDRSWCVCQACKFSGDPTALLWALMKKGVQVPSHISGLVHEANQPGEVRTLGALKRAAQEIKQEATYTGDTDTIPLTRELGGIEVPKGIYFGTYENQRPPYPDSAIQHLMDLPPEAKAYLTGPTRNLKMAAIEDWELGYHAPTGRITLPVRDCKGRLISVLGRACLGEQNPKFRHGRGFPKTLYLYGEHKVIRGRRGYLMEGNFDVVYMSQCGYNNVVCPMGADLSQIQAEKIVQFFSELYVAMDPDKAGEDAERKIKEMLSHRLPLKFIKLPGRDVDLLGSQTVRILFGNP